MNGIQSDIQFFQILFLVFLICAILLLILSIVLFFKFDIKKTFYLKTGRSGRMELKEISQKNENDKHKKQRKIIPMPDTKKTEKLSPTVSLYDMEKTQKEKNDKDVLQRKEPLARFHIIRDIMIIHSQENI